MLYPHLVELYGTFTCEHFRNISVIQAFAQQNQGWLSPARAGICHAALGDCISYDKENKTP